jgi:type I restriction enzyme S subunit
MKYKAYPEYKDSGVEWLGDIPSHWSLTRIKFITMCLDGSRVPLNSEERGRMQGDIPYWGANNVVDYVNDFIFDEELILLGEDGAPFFDQTKDVAFNVDGKVWPNNHVHVLRPAKSQVAPEFLKYGLNCADFHLYISGSTRDKLNQSDMNEIYIRVCELPEQKQIANFLDHETAKIDTLIEKQQQLIKLLKEKRQAIISHAVTKGINPNAPMKDSGIEWLGEVPTHWDIKRLRYIGLCQNGINIGADSFGSGYPFLSYGDAYKNEVLPNQVRGLVQSSEQDRKTYSVLEGDVIFTRTSETIEEIGLASTCLTAIENVSFAGFLIRFRPKRNLLDPNFSKYYFRSQLLRVFFVKEMNLVTRASLSQDLLKKLPVPLPSLEEQKQIAEFLDSKSSVFSRLIENVEVAIELMKERRTALISAAVTGKIDVRHHASRPAGEQSSSTSSAHGACDI